MNVVVDALAERLKVIGFTSEDEDFAEWAWGLWQTNRMDYTQVVIHTEAVMLGDNPLTDLAGATALGLPAILLGPHADALVPGVEQLLSF